MDFWENFWNIIWFFFWAFVAISSLFVLVLIVIDIFRDRTLAGGWKALWLVFLVFFPLITALVYVIARGRGMSERQIALANTAQARENDAYRPQASSSPAQDIESAKRLLDSGVISQGEFDALKSKALGNQYYGS
jgi:hypothetical protein